MTINQNKLIISKPVRLQRKALKAQSSVRVAGETSSLGGLHYSKQDFYGDNYE